MSTTKIPWPENHGLPQLRFKDGDVLIKLGEAPEHWLLLHKAVIQATMPALGPGLSPRWQRGAFRTNLESGAETEINTLALKFTDDTYVLEGQEVVVVGEYEGVDFAKSVYSKDWPEIVGWPRNSVLGRTVHAHKTLFALLYGFDMQFNIVTGHNWCYGHDSPETLEEDVNIVIDICALAEYYGCLNRVARNVIELLFAQKLFWVCVAMSPLRYTALARKLRSSELFFNAMRYAISGSVISWEEVGQELNLSAKTAEARFQPRLNKQTATMNSIRDDLMRLQLRRSSYSYDRESIPVSTTFFNAIRFKPKDRSEGQKVNEKSDFLARGIYGQWLAQQLVGEYLYEFWKVRAARAGTLSNAMDKIEKAAVSEDPTILFGYKIPSRIAVIFKLGHNYNPPKQVAAALRNLVMEAEDIVKNAVPEYSEDVDGISLTYRRAPCAYGVKDYTNGDIFTYLPMEEDELPWQSERAWEEISLLPEFGLEAASDEVVKGYGGVENKEDGDDVHGDDGEAVNSGWMIETCMEPPTAVELVQV